MSFLKKGHEGASWIGGVGVVAKEGSIGRLSLVSSSSSEREGGIKL